MIRFTPEHNLLKRHIGSARENRYRAKQRTSNSIQQSPPPSSLLSPDLLRARWNELYHGQNQNNVNK
jgi:hypothetical protein